MANNKNTFLVVVLVSIVLVACSPGGDNDQGEPPKSNKNVTGAEDTDHSIQKSELFGTWRIEHSDAGPFSINPSEGIKLEGDTVTISERSFYEPYFETRCENPKYSFEMIEDIQSFLDEQYRIDDPGKYGLDVASLQKFTVRCDNEDSTTFFYLPTEKSIVMYFDGLFFHLKK